MAVSGDAATVVSSLKGGGGVVVLSTNLTSYRNLNLDEVVGPTILKSEPLNGI